MNIRRITCIYVVMLVLQWIFGIAPHQSKMVDDYGGQIRVASEGQPLENMAAASTELPTEMVMQMPDETANLVPAIIWGTVLLIATAVVALYLLRKKP